MKTPLFVLMLLLSALAPGNVFALVGQTRAQIEDTMGAPVDVLGSHAVYQHKGYTVVVVYGNGISVCENISRAFVRRKTEDPVAIGAKLSDNEVQALLSLYGMGLPWKPGASEGWVLSVGPPIIATYRERQAPIRSHMTSQEEDAIRKTPSLLVADVAFALALRREQESRSATASNEAKELSGAFNRVLGHSVHTTKPPYPYLARANHLQGSGIISVTFDGAGCVASAKMVRSVGSDTLDSNTINYAKAYWSGKPNTTITLPMTYNLIR